MGEFQTFALMVNLSGWNLIMTRISEKNTLFSRLRSETPDHSLESPLDLLMSFGQ